MGIKQLSKLIKEKAGKSIVPRKINYYSSVKIAIDASLSIYQFLIAVRNEGASLGFGDTTTSHLIGIFYRTIKLVEGGIIPVYVFDGSAPAMKVHELKKRSDKRDKAQKLLEEAMKDGNALAFAKFEKRKIKIENCHIEDCKKLLQLMGIPFVTAPSEAEAYCAFLCRNKCVSAVATEDMAALCFGTPILLRNMNVSQAKKLDIHEYNLESILKHLSLTMDSFIDLCILLGCDYCETLRGIGPKRAYDFIKKHGSIEQILANEVVEIPEKFDFESARAIFKELPEIGIKQNFQIEYENIDKKAIIQFMVVEKGFDELRVSNGVDKIINCRKKSNQLKLESFFCKINK